MLDHIEVLPRSHSARRAGAQTTRERLIQVGLRRVLESGWAATGIDAVLRECAVPKGSFYHYFASKEAFGFALLESYQAFFMQRLTQWFLVAPPTSLPMLQIAMDGFLADAVTGMERYQYQRGCLVGALGQEVASLHEGFRAKLLEGLQEWEKTLSSTLFNSVRSYFIHSNMRRQTPSEADADKSETTSLLRLRCDAWARDFWVAWEGAVLRSLLARNPDALHAVVQRSMAQLADWPDFKTPAAPTADGIARPDTKTEIKAKVNSRAKSKKSEKSNEINAIQTQLNF